MNDFLILPHQNDYLDLKPLNFPAHCYLIACIIYREQCEPPKRWSFDVDQPNKRLRLKSLFEDDSIEIIAESHGKELEHLYAVVRAYTDHELVLVRANPPDNPITDAILRAWRYPKFAPPRQLPRRNYQNAGHTCNQCGRPISEVVPRDQDPEYIRFKEILRGSFSHNALAATGNETGRHKLSTTSLSSHLERIEQWQKKHDGRIDYGT